MTKNVLKFLNSKNAFWINILRCKYGEVHFGILRSLLNAPGFVDYGAKIRIL